MDQTIAIARRKLKTETDSNNIEMYKLWINEASENIKTHYQINWKKKKSEWKPSTEIKMGKKATQHLGKLKSQKRQIELQRYSPLVETEYRIIPK